MFLNNFYLGYLNVDSNNTFAEQVFLIPADIIVAGTNHIMVQVDEGTPNPDPAVSPTYGVWNVSIDSIRVCLGYPIVGGDAIAVNGSPSMGSIALVLAGLLLARVAYARIRERF